jgi:hypothetical protein
MVTYLVFLLYPVCMLKILLVLFTKKKERDSTSSEALNLSLRTFNSVDFSSSFFLNPRLIIYLVLSYIKASFQLI